MDANFTGEFFVPGASPERLNADHLNRYRFATDYASAAARALDIACGTGYGSAILKDAGAGSVTGVDLSVEALGHAQKHFGREGVTFTTGDITEFDAEPFDLITCFETIEHVADAAAALTNLRRLLREGGTLLISSPNRPVTSPMAASINDKPSNEWHVQEFTPAELRELMTVSGFSVEATVWGQRTAPPIPRSIMRRTTVSRQFATRLSPKVRRVRRGVPRYFVLAGH